MVKIHDSLRDSEGDMVKGRTKLFILSTDSEGSICDFLEGYAIVPEESGTLFIVDDWLIPQINKLKFIDGELKVKDGEAINEPKKSEDELKEEELLRQLAELRAKKD